MLHSSVPIKWLAALCIAACAPFLHAETADEFRQKGIDALNDSQTNPKSIVDAARFFTKAADAYEAAGDVEKNTEVNSFLYWCKKKMTLEDMEAFVKGGEAAVANTLNTVAEKKVDANEAQAWFDRATKFALDKPDEHLLIAIRYYEVADRFKGTEISLRAQDRSLSEQTLALGTKKPPKSAPPPTVVDATQPRPKVAVPDAAKLKDVEKELKTIMKEDFAKTKPEEKLALAKKLLTMADEAGDDAATKYIELREACSLAATGGDLPTTLKALSKLNKGFLIDAAAVRGAAFKALLDAAKTKDAAKAIGDSILEALEDGIAADQFAALRPLVGLADSAAAKAQTPFLTIRVKEKAAQIDELNREWPAAKAALEKLKSDAKQPAANLTAGRFTCLLKGDMEHGLPLLVCGSDAVLQKLAADDQADPAESAAQLLLADVWFDQGEKEKSRPCMRNMLGRAGYWYTKAQPSLAGLNKARVDKRLDQLAAMGITVSMGQSALAGKWTVTWPAHPEYGKRALEFIADGTIKIGPKENFGQYVPAKWSVANNAVMIQFKNGVTSRYTIVDENTLTQADGGDGRYTKQASVK